MFVAVSTEILVYSFTIAGMSLHLFPFLKGHCHGLLNISTIPACVSPMYIIVVTAIINFTISFSAFFYSLDVFSLFHRLFLNNTELKIFGQQYKYRIGVFVRWVVVVAQWQSACIQAVLGSTSGGDQIFLILYCLKKPVKEREYI